MHDTTIESEEEIKLRQNTKRVAHHILNLYLF